jgi:hypothetical protein
MVNYQNGKNYKIEDLGGEMCYIGSTTKDYLSKRMVAHRASYKRWQDGKGVAHYTVFDIFEKHDINNCRIVLVELCPCDSKDELLKREAYHINMSQCVNKVRPVVTKEQLLDDRKQFRIKNGERLSEIGRQYYADNKAYILEYMATKLTCACGSVIRQGDNGRHKKSIKHLKLIANNPLDV